MKWPPKSKVNWLYRSSGCTNISDRSHTKLTYLLLNDLKVGSLSWQYTMKEWMDEAIAMRSLHASPGSVAGSTRECLR